MATLKNKSLKKSLNEQAEENTQVTQGTSKNQRVVKEGKPSDHSRKHLDGKTPVVGVSIGSTINMENYESLRVDCWLTDTVQPNETFEQAYARIVQVVDSTLQNIANQYIVE